MVDAALRKFDAEEAHCVVERGHGKETGSWGPGPGSPGKTVSQETEEFKNL